MNTVADVLDRKDRPPYVRFEKRAVEDTAASLAAGHYVARDVDYALITPPYSKDVFITKVAGWLKQLEQDVMNQRIPPEWLDSYKKQYQAWQRGQDLPLEGTPIRGWGVISPAQQETLIRMNVLVVEDLARINDEGVKRIGMGALDIKNKAIAWLAQMREKGPLTMEVAADKAKIRELQGSIETLTRQVKALMEQQPVVQEESVGITASDLIEDDREALAQQYKQKFGKSPHPAMSLDNLRAKVA